jgi:hypothetical protein
VPGVLSERHPQRVLQETLTAVAANSHGLNVEQQASRPSGWRWCCRARRSPRW